MILSRLVDGGQAKPGSRGHESKRARVLDRYMHAPARDISFPKELDSVGCSDQTRTANTAAQYRAAA